MDGWQRFSKTSLLDKKEFYSNLTKDITETDFKHVERVWEDFRIQNLGKYHD